MKFRSLVFGIFLPLTFTPGGAHAAEVSAPLYVIRPILHAEQEKAELCLEFDHNLDAVGTVARFAPALRLELDGKNLPIVRKNISVGGDQICVSGLEHQKNYRLVLSALRDAKGQKLSRTYSLSFRVPARTPSLAFVQQNNRDGLNLWRDHIVLNSLNSSAVTVELFRISDPAKMAEAWGQRLQTALVPSESLYFARQNGALVWKKEIEPENLADKNILTDIDLTENGSSKYLPGLYLVVASDSNVPNNSDKDEKSKNVLSTVAASWIVQSDLTIRAIMDDANITVLTEAANQAEVTKNIRVLLLDANQKTLAETRSNDQGIARLPVKQDPPAKTIVALDDNGNVAFANINDVLTHSVLPAAATLSVEQQVYAPRDVVNLTLNMRDIHRHQQNLKGSVLQLLRPDHTLFDAQAVKLDANGTARLAFTAPAPNGLWHIAWRQEDGKQLAESSFRVSQNPSAPQLSVETDRTSVETGGSVMLTVHSHTGTNLVAPYVAGQVELVWKKSQHPFSSWKDYIFDDGKNVNSVPEILANFVTDKNGTAAIRVALPNPDQGTIFRQAQLHISANVSDGVAIPEPVVLSVRPPSVSVGINPQDSRGYFPENSLARFDVIAVDGSGHTQTLEDLAYHIYEQGRSFEWFQVDGRWDYKPQQQRRRIGGGSLYFADNGRAVIEWPVTSGAYQLEITDADGALLAHTDFNAGWISDTKESDAYGVLPLKASPIILSSGALEKITFTLPNPAIVTATMADDRIRGVIHAAYPAGQNMLSFTPAPDWGSRVLVRLEADYHIENNDTLRDVGQMFLSSFPDAPTITKTTPKTLVNSKTVPLADLGEVLKTVAQHEIAQRDTMSFEVAKMRQSAKPNILALAPVPLDHVPEFLSQTLGAFAFVTRDLAEQIDVLHSWRDVIVASGLLPDAEFQVHYKGALTRLAARQNNDGGFPALPDLGTSDLNSTASALRVLVLADDPSLRPVIEQAVRWMRHFLENTWFDERQRSARASAYAALAEAGKLDLASLHYFSDTSADKSLTPLAAAELAYAFAAVDDKPASAFWLDKVKTFTTNKQGLTADVAKALLANRFYESDLVPELMKTVAENIKESMTSEARSSYLSVLVRALSRKGAWKISVGKEEKTQHGVFVTALADKATLALRNPSSDHPLYAVEMAVTQIANSKNETRRHIYNLDGSEHAGALKRGETYIMMIEGAWRDERESVVLHDNPQSVFFPVTCLLQAPPADSFLGWLAAQAPSPVRACEKSPSGVTALLAHDEKDGDIWRAAYLAKAVSAETKNLREPRVEAIILPNPDDKDVRH